MVDINAGFAGWEKGVSKICFKGLLNDWLILGDVYCWFMGAGAPIKKGHKKDTK